jgi:two-component system, sensor histidine kinase and response regulator
MSSLILAVDDNQEITDVLALILRSKGYEVTAAVSGVEALAMMESRRPDLILCDIMMPGMDGFEVFRRVRADRRWRAIPFVFLSALNDTQTRTSGTELGVEAYITKPFNRQELLALVSGLLRRAVELQTYTASELDSFKSQLLFMITHELNTPLSVIRMLTDSMRNGSNRMTKAQIVDYLELLSRSTGELSWIVESMLLALQIDSGRAQTLYDHWATNQMLGPAIQGVLGRAESKAQERNVTIVTSGLDQPVWVHAHEQQLVQVLSRILDNAIRFSPKGDSVDVSVRCEQDRALIQFADHGPGMTPDEVDEAFDRLRQINRAQQEQQGVGLSLSLVRSLVTIHRGEILVESAPGQGSKFTVALPIVEGRSEMFSK